MQEEILKTAQDISHANEAEQALLIKLCEVETAVWTKRLRIGVTPVDCGDAFVCAAAFYAVADWMEQRVGGSYPTSFKAGEVSVKEKSVAELAQAAQLLRSQADAFMAPYQQDDRFYFSGVQG